jgi:hypothetical protein
MKMIKALLTVMLGMALQVAAAPPPQNSSASHTADTNSIPSKMMSLQPTAKRNDQIDRVENTSSRPWTEIVGWHPGVSQFPDAENHESQLTLLSVSFGPRNHPQPATLR